MSDRLLRARDVRVVDSTRFNIDRTRFYISIASGFACYRGSTDWQGEWHGRLAGIASTEIEAQRFLDGAIVDLRKVS